MNKYIFGILLLILGSITFSSDAQAIRGALIGGVNFTQVDGDHIYGYDRIGANAGAAAIVPFTDMWSLTLETIFSMEGSRKKGVAGQWEKQPDNVKPYPPPYDADSFYLNGAYNLHLDYVRIPLVVHYNDRNLALGAGFQYGRLVRIKEIEQDTYNTTDIAEEAYKNNDFSILADVKYRIYSGLFFNFRFSYSLVSIRTREFHDITNPIVQWNRNQYHNILTVRLMWVINDKGISIQSQRKDKHAF